MNLKELNKKIIDWAKEREIDKKGTIEGQAIKTIEEMSELIKGICKDDINLIKDSIGDVYVTLVIGCMLSGVKMHEVVLFASEELIADGINDVDLSTYCGERKENILNSLVFEMHSFLDKMSYEIDDLTELFKVLMCVSSINDTSITECVELAYKEIAGRKGKMIDGVFVKEEDLKD